MRMTEDFILYFLLWCPLGSVEPPEFKKSLFIVTFYSSPKKPERGEIEREPRKIETLRNFTYLLFLF